MQYCPIEHLVFINMHFKKAAFEKKQNNFAVIHTNVCTGPKAFYVHLEFVNVQTVGWQQFGRINSDVANFRLT